MAKENKKTGKEIRKPYILKRPEGDRSDFDTVTLNGKTWQIEYSKTVMLPEEIIEILEESRKNTAIAENNAISASEMMAERMRGM